MSVSSDPLRVTITRSGGVAGVRRVWSVEVRSLSAEQSAELRRLVAAAEEPEGESEELVDEFREFIEHVSPEDFG